MLGDHRYLLMLPYIVQAELAVAVAAQLQAEDSAASARIDLKAWRVRATTAEVPGAHQHSSQSYSQTDAQCTVT